MSLWLQQKYARMIPLQGFELKSHGNYYANFRCCICGDSKKKTLKKRGWFRFSDGNLLYKCYNCGYSRKFPWFLKEHFPNLYSDYLREYLTESGNPFVANEKKKEEPNFFQTENVDLQGLQKISELPSNHKAFTYCIERKIPIDKIFGFYYADNFYNWCAERQPDAFPGDYSTDKRIVLPLRDRNGNIFGVQGRTIENCTPKYLTCKFRESYPKIFGWDKVDLHREMYFLEGAIDSLFIDNCVAVSGALGGIKDIMKFIGVTDFSRAIAIPDNEKRNKATCDFIEQLIHNGFPVVIWPENVVVKDVNAMITAGYSEEKIMSIIKDNTFRGAVAKMKFGSWRR